MTRRNAESAARTKELARHTVERVQHSAAEMQRLQQAIASIDAAGQQTAKIARTIDEIAFQTNILALNAATGTGRPGAGPAQRGG
jgi:methyl-accepting chemotaxis protein